MIQKPSDVRFERGTGEVNLYSQIGDLEKRKSESRKGMMSSWDSIFNPNSEQVCGYARRGIREKLAVPRLALKPSRMIEATYLVSPGSWALNSDMCASGWSRVAIYIQLFRGEGFSWQSPPQDTAILFTKAEEKWIFITQQLCLKKNNNYYYPRAVC